MSGPMNILDELRWRGLYADCTDLEALSARLATGPLTLYCGFDPTADSLHVGNLVPLLCLRRFQQAGHVPLALAGGATGMIGDPSGKSKTRPQLTREQVQANVEAVSKQVYKILDPEKTEIYFNKDWLGKIR
jgi:tyrosyl-tRNA synthetase